VHELGHYVSLYHYPDSLLPYDLGEVHSQGGEWLLLQYLKGSVDPEVYEVLLLWRLWYGLETVILSTLIDEYEEEVYIHREVSSPRDFSRLFYEVLSEYPGYDKGRPEKRYIYSQYVTIEAPVYYLSYATSELASMALYRMAEEQGYAAAQKSYTELCLEVPVELGLQDALERVGLPDPFAADTVRRILEGFAFAADRQAA